ncbi:MAG: fatty acid desaturase [Isosphaeraceae bacterium]
MPVGVLLGRVEGWRSAVSLAREWASVAGVIALASYLDAVPAYVAAVILIGALQHRLAALGHEASHGTLFRDPFRNDLVADWFCFFPVLGAVRNYRRWHLAHHAAPNDPERDPDLLNLGPWLLRDRFPMTRGRLVWAVFLRWASGPLLFVRYGWSYVRMNTFGIGEGLRPIERDRSGYSPRAEALARTAFYGTAGLALAALGPRATLIFAALWILPLATTFPYFLMLRDTFQHTNADTGRYTNTRIFRVHPLVRWAVFPYGQDLHLPHHAVPSVPHYRLEELHRHLVATREGYGPAAVECRGIYWHRSGGPTIADTLAHGR